jgi:hypothetical protein
MREKREESTQERAPAVLYNPKAGHTAMPCNRHTLIRRNDAPQPTCPTGSNLPRGKRSPRKLFPLQWYNPNDRQAINIQDDDKLEGDPSIMRLDGDLQGAPNSRSQRTA